MTPPQPADLDRFREAHLLAPLVAGHDFAREVDRCKVRIRRYMTRSGLGPVDAALVIEAGELTTYRRLLVLAAAVDLLADWVGAEP